MKKRHGIEMYSLSEFDANDLPGSFASWDFGRRNGLPLWPEFAGGQYFEEKNFYTHLCPSSTAFEFPLKGELLIEHNDRITLVKPGWLYILPGGEANTLRGGPSGSCWKLSVGLCGPLVMPLLILLGFTGERNPVELTSPEKLCGIIDAMTPLLYRKAVEDVPSLAALAFRFLMELRMQQPAVMNPLIADAERIFEFNVANPIGLAAVARELNLSELKLIRMFRKHLGMTPKNYLIGLRMRKAASLLTHSAYSVGEIAQMCGYSSSHCLARAFRKHQGVSPLEYRKLYGGSVR